MLALINIPNGREPVEIREVPEPAPAPNETLVEVDAFSINRGELSLLASRPEGRRPAQDIAGVVAQRAADGSSSPAAPAWPRWSTCSTGRPRKSRLVIGLFDFAGGLGDIIHVFGVCGTDIDTFGGGFVVPGRARR